MQNPINFYPQEWFLEMTARSKSISMKKKGIAPCYDRQRLMSGCVLLTLRVPEVRTAHAPAETPEPILIGLARFQDLSLSHSRTVPYPARSHATTLALQRSRPHSEREV
jgi:hypothetical protein